MRFALGAAGAVVGGFLGGPVGAQIGWAAGSLIGGSFEKQETVVNEGPRLDDLSGPTSGIIGRQIPIVYGTDRVSGGIIWNSNVRETVHEESHGGGGKGGGGGQPEQVSRTYTYSIDFALALVEGPISGIRRIWANKTLIYDLNQDVISSLDLNMTIYTGTETQLPDPTIEAAEGVGNVSAHRGLAYILFHDFQLEEFGNRVPGIIEVEVSTTGNTGNVADIVNTTASVFRGTGQDSFIFQSPNTGLVWSSASGTTAETQSFAIGLSPFGQVVRSLPQDDTSWSGNYMYKHNGISGVIPVPDGSYIFGSWVYYYNAPGEYYYGLKLYDEFGRYEGQYKIQPVTWGSFNFWNLKPTIAVDGIWIFNNYGDDDHIYLEKITASQSIDAFGRVIISFAHTEQSNYSNFTINNTDFTETYTGNIIVLSNQSFRLFEDDPYGIRTRPVCLKTGLTSNQLGVCYYTFEEGANLRCDIIVAELIHSFTFTGDVFMMGEYELENGDTYVFISGDTGSGRKIQ